MHLSPRDLEKLALHNAGFLSQKRLARGVRLNYPEAIALLSNVLLELIRDGARVADLMDVGRKILGRREVLEGVAEMISEVQLEGTFPDGTKLVTVHQPIVREKGDLALAMYGSFLPPPTEALFEERVVTSPGEKLVPGAVIVGEGAGIELNAGRPTRTLTVTNTGDRPIQVGSHFPFEEANRALAFEREQAKGMRLDIAAGTAVRFEPGESRTVQLVATAATDTAGWESAASIARRYEALAKGGEPR